MTKTRGAILVGSVASFARLAVVAWAAGRFGPAGDGVFYDRFAHRIAAGLGYTVAWPDGVVTHAAHYPVGYPAIVGAFYAVFGGSGAVAMTVNAILGVACALSAYRMLLACAPVRLAAAGGIAVALHPALVPYTVAIMTEGAAAALLCMAGAIAEHASTAERRGKWWLLLGATMGLATLVRPQCIALAPFVGWLAVREASARARAKVAAIVTAIGIACCLPWTARNCARMDRCSFVSANGGWNLLIGAQTESGTWQEVDVPEPCRNVWGEADKDACFARAARAEILAHPGRWLALVPKKLSMTFDYLGGAPWYLRASNPDAFSERAKIALATVETVAARLLLVGALVAVARIEGARRRARRVVVGAGIACALGPWAWPGYLALGAGILLLGRRAIERGGVLLGWTAASVLATAATHAAFFGAGRYGMVVAPLVAAIGFARPFRDSST